MLIKRFTFTFQKPALTMSEPRPKLFLLDAMALISMAFFALNKNSRINSKGLNT